MSNPINIALFGGGNNDDNLNHYFFQIILFLKNKEPIVIEETSNEKYINIFSYDNKINFNDINFYELNIRFGSFIINKYSIKNKFIISHDTHVYKDNMIYLEISKNTDNYAKCCIYINNDNSRLFFTPPNY